MLFPQVVLMTPLAAAFAVTKRRFLLWSLLGVTILGSAYSATIAYVFSFE